MDTNEALSPVLYAATSFLNDLSAMPDHRQAGKVAYRLDEVLLLARLVAGASCIACRSAAVHGPARFEHETLDLLRRFLPFAIGTSSHDGTPSHDHLGDIFAALDPRRFPSVFRGLGRRPDRDRAGGHRHRWKDFATLRAQRRQRRSGRDPNGVGLRGAANPVQFTTPCAAMRRQPCDSAMTLVDCDALRC